MGIFKPIISYVLKKAAKTLLLALSCCLVCACCLYASFSEIFGTRNSALGKSGVAAASGVSEIFVNPAGLSLMDDNEIIFEYQKPFLGSEEPGYDIPGYHSIDISKGCAAVGISLPESAGYLSVFYGMFDSNSQYRESAYGLGYSRPLDDIILKESGERFFVGANFKYLSVDYRSDDYTEEFFSRYGGGSTGFAADFGLKYSPSEDINFGLSLINALSSDLGLLYENKPEQQMYFGSAFKASRRLELLLSYSQKASYPGSNFHLGASYEIVRDQCELLLGGNKNEITAGFGINFKDKPDILIINYAYSFPLMLSDNYGTHGISVLFKLPSSREKSSGDIDVTEEDSDADGNVKKKKKSRSRIK